MSDGRLRTMERRWTSSGALEDEAALLHERLRVGVLTQGRYDFALALGAPVLGGEETPPLGFQEWLSALPFQRKRKWLERDFVRVPIAIARALLPCVELLGASSRYRAALEAAEALLVRASLSAQAAEALAAFPQGRVPARESAPSQERVLATFVGAAHGPTLSCEGFEALARQALYPGEGWWVTRLVEQDVEDALEVTFPRGEGRLWRLRLAIRDDLLPWALGYRDPVRTRVAKRGEVDILPEDLAE